MRLTSLRAAPVLETERLTLAPHSLDDLADCVALWSDREVTRYIGGRPLVEEEVWARVLRYAGLWSLLGIGYWAVRERGTGRFVGEVGLADFRRELTPSIAGTPEAGWILAPWAHGVGFATEAVRGVLAWADQAIPAIAPVDARTVCLVAPDNAASMRVAEKCGFRELVRTTYRESPTVVLQRTRD